MDEAVLFDGARTKRFSPRRAPPAVRPSRAPRTTSSSSFGCRNSPAERRLAIRVSANAGLASERIRSRHPASAAPSAIITQTANPLRTAKRTLGHLQALRVRALDLGRKQGDELAENHSQNQLLAVKRFRLFALLWLFVPASGAPGRDPAWFGGQPAEISERLAAAHSSHHTNAAHQHTARKTKQPQPSWNTASHIASSPHPPSHSVTL